MSALWERPGAFLSRPLPVNRAKHPTAATAAAAADSVGTLIKAQLTIGTRRLPCPRRSLGWGCEPGYLLSQPKARTRRLGTLKATASLRLARSRGRRLLVAAHGPGQGGHAGPTSADLPAVVVVVVADDHLVVGGGSCTHSHAPGPQLAGRADPDSWSRRARHVAAAASTCRCIGSAGGWRAAARCPPSCGCGGLADWAQAQGAPSPLLQMKLLRQIQRKL